MNAPCKDCPDRHTLCHMDCPKYLEYRAERDEISRLRAMTAELNAERGRRIERLQRSLLLKRKRLGK